MFENIIKFFKKVGKKETINTSSRDTAKERLHLVLMQDRANVSADFLELMKQEIIEVIKKYIEVDESAIDVRLTNKNGEDGENNAPALYANIPILNIRNDMKKIDPATGKIEPEKKPEINAEEKMEEKAKPEEKQKEKQQENKEEEVNTEDEMEEAKEQEKVKEEVNKQVENEQ